MEGGPNIQQREDLIDSTDEVQKGCWFSCCHPRGVFHRFIALFFMCFLGFGSYFCYDSVASLEDHLKQDLNITTTQYTLFYSMYSWPNVILCFIGGFLIDRVFGIRLGTNIYMAITFLGQIIFATGAVVNTFWLMLVGRFIFGIGAESLAVAQNNYAVLWFKGKELNMVFGLQLSFARVGSAVNFLIMESIYKWITTENQGYIGLGIVLFIATLTCLFSMLCSLILGFIDKRAEKILARSNATSNEPIQLTDITKFSIPFWLLSVICVSYYVAIFPFIGLGKEFFMTKFHLSEIDANFVNSIVYLISAVASPIFGLIIDKVGRNILWIFIAISVTAGSHCLLAFTPVNPYVGMVSMGLAYSCLACGLWPLVSLLIPEYQLGTAYGVCQAIQNLGLAVFTIVAGNIEEHYGYTWLEVFFISSLSIALLTTIILWLTDLWNNGLLNLTPKARASHSQSISNIEERTYLLHSEEPGSSVEHNLLPSSDLAIRNRYLSKIGAPANQNMEE